MPLAEPAQLPMVSEHSRSGRIGAVALLGSPSAEHPGLQSPAGAAYVFRRLNGSWTLTDTLRAQDAALFDRLGGAVCTDGSQVVVGADGKDVIGAAYVYSLAQDAWTDLGQGLEGLRGVPDLLGGGTLAPSTPVSLSLSDARPDATACTIVGTSFLGAPFRGGVFGPAAVGAVVVCETTGPLGRSDTHLAWPPGYPSGFEFFLQSWIVDPAGPAGLSATATLRGVTP